MHAWRAHPTDDPGKCLGINTKLTMIEITNASEIERLRNEGTIFDGRQGTLWQDDTILVHDKKGGTYRIAKVAFTNDAELLGIARGFWSIKRREPCPW